MLFRKKKPAPVAETFPYGFKIPEQPETVCSGRLLVCLMKGLLIFAAAYGTVGGIISSFRLPSYQGLLFMILLVMSVLLAFLHYSRALFNIFYPVIFVAFTYFIFSFRYMVNSGYQAFINILQQTYGDYYLIDTYRQSSEYFSDRAMTITFAAAFIGFFLVLLLNIFISEYMSLVAVIFLTFPLFQIGIFVEKMPSMIYFVLLIFSYFMVGILRSSRHFLLPYRDKKWTEFKLKQKNHVISYRYHASGKLFWQLMLLFFCFALSIGLITLPMISSTTNTRLSSARRGMDEYMQVLTQSGLQGFFDRYPARGGISGGRLGGVSAVRPDYQTDLNITFVPFSYDTLYLKAYTGSLYTGSSWDPLPKQEGSPALLPHLKDTHFATARMEIENLDAQQDYYYIPYYPSTDFEPQHVIRSDTLYPEGVSKTKYHYTYHPNTLTLKEITKLKEKDPAATLEDPEPYLTIPDQLKTYLESLHAEIGKAEDPAGQAELIYQYFREHYPYSQTPGTTPMNEDFVQYFLQTQQRGYCAHFASAGAMLMRSYGYPARYVEGYSVSLTDVSEGSEVTDAVYEDWFQGDNSLGQTGVVTVPVSDGAAHAWVEVFIEGFGWTVCEFTPPSDEEDQSSATSGFWELFSGLFTLSGSEPDTVDSNQITNTVNETGENINRFFSNSVFRPLIIVLSLLVILFVLYRLLRLISFHGRMALAYRKGEHRLRIGYLYQKLTARLLRKGLLSNAQTFILPSELALLHQKSLYERLSNADGKIGKDITEWTDLIEKCLYSQSGITSSQADLLSAFLRQYKKALR